MILKSLMKNPILVIGFLFMAIFLFQLRDGGFFAKRAESMIPTSCKAVVVRLAKYMHKSWDIECKGNNLQIEIEVDEVVIPKLLSDMKELRPKMYKALANSYSTISKYSPEDSLSRTDFISVRLIHHNLTLNSISEGKHVANVKSLKDLNNLSKHFSQTVRVQEVTK